MVKNKKPNPRFKPFIEKYMIGQKYYHNDIVKLSIDKKVFTPQTNSALIMEILEDEKVKILALKRPVRKKLKKIPIKFDKEPKKLEVVNRIPEVAEKVLSNLCENHAVTLSMLLGRDKSNGLNKIRGKAYLLLKDKIGYNYPQIANLFNVTPASINTTYKRYKKLEQEKIAIKDKPNILIDKIEPCDSIELELTKSPFDDIENDINKPFEKPFNVDIDSGDNWFKIKVEKQSDIDLTLKVMNHFKNK